MNEKDIKIKVGFPPVVGILCFIVAIVLILNLLNGILFKTDYQITDFYIVTIFAFFLFGVLNTLVAYWASAYVYLDDTGITVVHKLKNHKFNYRESYQWQDYVKTDSKIYNGRHTYLSEIQLQFQNGTLKVADSDQLRKYLKRYCPDLT